MDSINNNLHFGILALDVYKLQFIKYIFDDCHRYINIYCRDKIIQACELRGNGLCIINYTVQIWIYKIHNEEPCIP